MCEAVSNLRVLRSLVRISEYNNTNVTDRACISSHKRVSELPTPHLRDFFIPPDVLPLVSGKLAAVWVSSSL